MTTVIGYQTLKTTYVIAADTKLSSSQSYIGNANKIFSFGRKNNTTYIGASGHYTALLALQHELKYADAKFLNGWNSVEEIYERLIQLHAAFKERHFNFLAENDDSQFESSRFSSIVVNKSGIYSTLTEREVIKHSYHAAIGSGSNYALGILDYNSCKTSEIDLSSLFQTVSKYDPQTGSNYQTHEIHNPQF